MRLIELSRLAANKNKTYKKKLEKLMFIIILLNIFNNIDFYFFIIFTSIASPEAKFPETQKL